MEKQRRDELTFLHRSGDFLLRPHTMLVNSEDDHSAHPPIREMDFFQQKKTSDEEDGDNSDDHRQINKIISRSSNLCGPGVSPHIHIYILLMYCLRYVFHDGLM